MIAVGIMAAHTVTIMRSALGIDTIIGGGNEGGARG
jgi:hypothetical protein